MVELLWLIPALPLAGFVVLLLVGKRLGEPAAGWLGTAAVGLSFVTALVVFAGLWNEPEHTYSLSLFSWIPAGDFSVDVGGPRPLMRGDLVSRNLVFRDLAGMVGAEPDPRVAKARQPEQAARGAPRRRVLPDEPYRLDRLHAANAEVRFRGEHVISTLPLEDVTADLALRDGKLTLKPLNLSVAGGRILFEQFFETGLLSRLHLAKRVERQARIIGGNGFLVHRVSSVLGVVPRVIPAAPPCGSSTS